MNGDTTQSLGALRIANPDEESAPSSSPVPDGTVRQSTRTPPTSSHSSSSTVTEKQRQLALPALPSDSTQASGFLGFDPKSFSTQSSYSLSPVSPPILAEQTSYSSRMSQQRSTPLEHVSEQELDYVTYHSSMATPDRSYVLPPAASSRPISSLHDNGTLGLTPDTSGTDTYRHNDDHGLGLARRSSKSASAITQNLFREPSRRERGYRQPQTSALPFGSGSAPVRRSSRHAPLTTAGLSSQLTPPRPSTYAPEGGPLPSSEEWKDKGAAVSVRQAVDADGKIVSKQVKKGVKDFNFGRTLGEGSYSTVLAATDRQTLREYAIKVLDKRHIIKEKKVKYVNIEKDTLNRLTEHPGIVRLYYTFQDERSLYFVLDLASGGELLGVLKKMGTFDEECTRFYGAEILDAVEYMHSRGVIHRDLKPENVLLDDRMHVKITDFGTAKILQTKSSQRDGLGGSPGDPLDGADTDRAVSFVGTAEYVSPELLTDKNACKASDLWAFGCIIYQLLAGRPPFKAGNEYQTFQKIVGLEYAFPDGFPEVARDLVERLLVLDPAKRLPVEHIKNHQFFDGVVWGKGMWSQKPPRLKSYTPQPPDPIKLNGSTMSSFPSTIISPSNQKQATPGVSSASVAQLKPHPRLITELPPPSQLDIEWSPVLTRNNERILKLGNLIVSSNSGPHSPSSKTTGGDSQTDTPKKFSRFFGGSTTKKRQRLVMITSSARIVLAAAGGEEKKTKMEISLLGPNTTWKSFKDSKGLTSWVVDTVSLTVTIVSQRC